jgi:hypothetical protein
MHFCLLPDSHTHQHRRSALLSHPVQLTCSHCVRRHFPPSTYPYPASSTAEPESRYQRQSFTVNEIAAAALTRSYRAAPYANKAHLPGSHHRHRLCHHWPRIPKCCLNESRCFCLESRNDTMLDGTHWCYPLLFSFLYFSSLSRFVMA